MGLGLRLTVLIALLLFVTGAAFATQIDTYNDSTYSHVKKVFQSEDTVYLKAIGIGADPNCLDEKTAKIEYYAPGNEIPYYTHVCTSSTCYFPHDSSGSVKDLLSLKPTDPSGQWTAKVYREKYDHCNESCGWDYRGKTTFNVTSLGYSCSIEIISPTEDSMFLIYQPVNVVGRVLCEGKNLDPNDFYAQVEWKNGSFSPKIQLNGSEDGPWLFTTAPDSNFLYGDSGYKYLKARLYKKGACGEENNVYCTIDKCYLCGDVDRNGRVDAIDVDYLISYTFSGGEEPRPIYSGNLNRDDVIDVFDVVTLIDFAHRHGRAPVCEETRCGDVNRDGKIDGLDIDFLINYTFSGGPAPVPLKAGDLNGDGAIDVLDVVILINHVYRGEPSPTCGVYVESQEPSGALEIYRSLNKNELLSMMDDAPRVCDSVAATSPVRRILVNAPPISKPGNNQSVELGETAYFDGSESFDPDGTIVSYSWDFGDGSSASGVTASHSYPSIGAFTVTLTVEDNLGATDSNSIIVTVGKPVAEYITISPENATIVVGGKQTYTAIAHDSHGNSWDVTSVTSFESDGGIFEGNLFTAGGTPGTFEIAANYGDLVAFTHVTIIRANAERIEIYPKNANVGAGGALLYFATAFDEFNNSWDVTSETSFSSPGGAFTGNLFSAGESPGTFEVHGTYGGLSDSTNVNVISSRPVSLSISPKSSTINSKETQSYTAIAFDQYGNSSDVTEDTVFSSDAGIFAGNVLTSNGTLGTFLVTGEYRNLTDYANITVKEKPSEPPGPGPISPGNSGSSSLGFSGGGSRPPPPVKTCQKLGETCSVTSDCCIGACTSSVCKLPEEKPPAKGLVEVIAPEQANLGDNITVKLRYVDNSEPVPGADLQVISPSYEIIKLKTDKNGIAYYVPTEEGWHDYLVPNYEVWGIASTYVKGNANDSGRINIIRYLTRSISTTDTGAGLFSGLFLGRLAPELLGLLVLVLFLLGYGAYLYYKEQEEPPINVDVEPLVLMKKIKVRKPKSPEPPAEPQQPAQPQNPT